MTESDLEQQPPAVEQAAPHGYKLILPPGCVRIPLRDGTARSKRGVSAKSWGHDRR
ncbi:hypothetical protein [Streptomyces decoyicus]|uniref:hypothetical protein n=1 Tax=Streptomyces decoyicus TaxID=249567 RepID=UPI000AC9E915|nr:hypothetical protein [Streptomyces decoyicus]QZY17190.1 hypothetical protein K7C20_19605 [Streptomyces decoyicus]